MANDTSSTEVDAKIKKLDNDLDVLRRRYEQFFVGNQDRPPKNKRSQVERQFRELERTRISNTSLRFKFRSLQQRFTSLKQKWNRIEREIEQGTYAPHKRKARRREQERGERDDQQADGARDEQDDQEDSAGRDDVFEIDEGEFSSVDLKSLERELEEMDQKGEFEKHVPTEKMSRSDLPDDKQGRQARGEGNAPSPGARPSSTSDADSPDAGGDPASSGSDSRKPRQDSHRPSEDNNVFSGQEQTRRDKLRTLQDKLGLSNRSSDEGGSRSEDNRRHKKRDDRATTKKEKLKKIQQRLGRKDDGSGGDAGGQSSPGGERGNDPKQRDRQKRRQDSNQSRSDRQVVDRSGRDRASRGERSSSSKETSSSTSDDDDEGRFRTLYRRFIDAKRDCDERVDHLDYEKVRESLRRREKRLRRKHDARQVRFNVVRKKGRVYLQPDFD